MRSSKLYFILMTVLLPSMLAVGESSYPALPDWRALEFEKRAFFAVARSSLEINEAANDSGHWVIQVRNSVVDNSEKIFLEFDPVTGRAITRTRLSSGKDKRYKSYDYKKGAIARVRREPGPAAASDPNEWNITSTNTIPHPSSIQNEVVASTYALIGLASELIKQPGAAKEVVVHTDFNFYKVSMTSSEWIPLMVKYETDGAGVVEGKRNTVAVKLRISPLHETGEGSDFSLLGLQDGYIVMSFDKKTGVLLQLLGEEPRIGTTEINLKKVYPRDVP